MRAFLFRAIGTLAIACLLVAALSCARDQQLVSISIQPSVQNFGDSSTPVSADAGLNVHLRALGTYIHPPVTKDITSQVVWASNTPQMVTVDATGLITATGNACGNTLISATVQTNNSAGNRSSSGAIVTGTMQANVICFTGSGGSGGSSFLLTVNFSGAGFGTVTSTPAGLGCATACSGTFSAGSPISLTAAPNSGSAFGSWLGCDTVSGPTCNLVLNSNRVVTVTFN